MKRGIIALILIAAIGVFSFSASKAVIEKADELESAAQAACKNEQYIEQLKDVWEDNKDFFSLFVSHIHLEPIDQRLNSIELVTPDEITESCAEIAAFAEEIGELMKPTLYNVF